MLINKNFNSQRVKSSWREILVQNLNTSKVAYSHLLWGFTFKRRLQCIRKIHVQYAFQMKLIIWWVKNNNFLFVIFHRLYIYKKDCLKPSIKKVHLYTFTVCFSFVTNHLIGQKCDIFYIIFHSDCMYSMLTKKEIITLHEQYVFQMMCQKYALPIGHFDSDCLLRSCIKSTCPVCFSDVINHLIWVKIICFTSWSFR